MGIGPAAPVGLGALRGRRYRAEDNRAARPEVSHSAFIALGMTILWILVRRMLYSNSRPTASDLCSVFMGRLLGASGDDELEPLAAGLFRELLEAAPDGMVLVGAPGRILLVNAETERLFGYQRHELVGQPVELLVPFGSREQHVGLRASYFADPHPRLTGAGLEISGLRKDGSEFPAEVLLSPLGPEKGGPLTLAAIRDISDRRTTEDGSSHLAALVRSSDDAIVGQGLDGGVVSWNAAATRLYGYSAEEVLGKPVSVLVPPGHDDELANIVETVRHGYGSLKRIIILAVGDRELGIRDTRGVTCQILVGLRIREPAGSEVGDQNRRLSRLARPFQG